MARKPRRKGDGSYDSNDQTPKVDQTKCKHPGFVRNPGSSGWDAFCPLCELEWFIPRSKS